MQRSNNYITGIVLILLGVLFLIQQFTDFFSIGFIFQLLWPSLFILGGILAIVNDPRRPFWGIILTMVGLTILTGIVFDFNVWNLWPIFLVAAGIRIIFGDKFTAAASAENKNNYVHKTVIFSGLEEKITSKSFEGGSISAFFGGAELDLTKVEFAENAELNLTAAFGGISIRLPENVEIINKGFGFLGGFEVKGGSESSKNAKKLIISGSAVFGGIEVKS